MQKHKTRDALRFSVVDDLHSKKVYGLFVPPDTKSWDECEDSLYALLDPPVKGHKYIVSLMNLLDIEPTFLDIYAHIGHEYLNNNFIEEANKWYTDGLKVARTLMPKNFREEIQWGSLENRPFLRLHHGHILCLIKLKHYSKAEKLVETHLRWNKNDNQGLRYLLGELCILNGKLQKAKKHLSREDVDYPTNAYSLALIEFQKDRYVQSATALRRGFLQNQYVAEIITGRSNPNIHFHWHSSNIHEPEQAIWYTTTFGFKMWREVEGAIDFCDWLFNCSAILKERSEIMATNEGLTHESDFHKRGEFSDRRIELVRSIDDTTSKQIVKKFTNRFGNKIWPWEYQNSPY